MPSLQRCEAARLEDERRGQSHQDARALTPGEKTIASLQVCIRCRKKSPFKRGRKRCPHCDGLLIVKIMVLKETRIST